MAEAVEATVMVATVEEVLVFQKQIKVDMEMVEEMVVA